MAEKPVYVVGKVRREGEDGPISGIDVVEFEVPAATQEKACDAIAEVLPEGKYELGAFLASSLRTFEYEPERVTKLNKTPKHAPPARGES